MAKISTLRFEMFGEDRPSIIIDIKPERRYWSISDERIKMGRQISQSGMVSNFSTS
jgi:hypothetical protein